MKKGPRNFAAGCFGTLIIFAAFYLRRSSIVLEEIEAMTAIGLVLAAGCFLVVVLGAGFWAYSERPRALRVAFSIGLSVPSLLFGANLALTKQDDVKKGALFFPVAFLAAASEREPGPLWRGVRLVLAPLTTVARLERREVEEENAKLAAGLKTARGDATKYRLDAGRARNAAAAEKRRSADIQKDLGSRLAVAKTALGDAEQRAVKSKEQADLAAQMVTDLQARARDLDGQVANLERELATADGGDDLRKRIDELEARLKDSGQSVEEARWLKSTVSHLGKDGARMLVEVLERSKVSDARAGAALGLGLLASTDRKMKARLTTIAKTDRDPVVQRAAKRALETIR